MNSGVRIWLSVGAMVMLAGCQSVPFGSLGAPSPKYTNEVGSVRMSVISVGPWDEYVTELQPHYSLDAEGAYAKAIPTTRSTHEGAREHAIASVRVGPKGSDGNGGPNNGPSKEQAIEKADLKDTELVDSRLRYRAATSLYQEVKLLNRQVVDAPVYRGYAAYVVRLQLSVMPRMRHLPYDVYVNLSFFEQQFKDGRYRTLSQLPIVFPLIAADSLEASLNSAALNRIRELGLAAGTDTAGLEAKTGGERLSSALGRDINSTFTAGRLNDNSVRIRIGAFQDPSPGAGYAMVPRTEAVTVLLLVRNPDAAGDQAAAARTISVQKMDEMVHAVDGRSLPTKSYEQERRDVEEIVKFFEIPKEQFVSALWDNTIEGSWDAFANTLDGLCLRNERSRPATLCVNGHYTAAEQLWNEIAALQPGYVVDWLRFRLPPYPRPQMFPEQSVRIDDDGEAAHARVFGASGLKSADLCAGLVVGGRAGRQEFFAVEEVVLTGGGRAADLKFATQRKGKAGDTAHEPRDVELRIARSEDVDACWKQLRDNKAPAVFRSRAMNYRFTEPPAAAAKAP